MEWTPSWPPWLIEFASSEQRPIQQWSTWRSRKWNGEWKEIQKEEEGQKPFGRVGAASGLALSKALPRGRAQHLRDCRAFLKSFLLFFTPSSFLSHTQTRLPLCWRACSVHLLECRHLRHPGKRPRRGKGLLYWYVSKFCARTHRKTSCPPRSGSTFSCLG